MSGVRVRFIRMNERAYAAERMLRYRVLRAPLGMALGSEENAAEADCLHLVAEDSAGSVVGCLIFRSDEGHQGQLMQMAVDPSAQGQGVGRALVTALDDHCRSRRYKRITLHARESAQRFYERLGYAAFGEPFDEVGIPHRHMVRRL